MRATSSLCMAPSPDGYGIPEAIIVAPTMGHKRGQSAEYRGDADTESAFYGIMEASGGPWLVEGGAVKSATLCSV